MRSVQPSPDFGALGYSKGSLIAAPSQSECSDHVRSAGPLARTRALIATLVSRNVTHRFRGRRSTFAGAGADHIFAGGAAR